ncbi:MAG: DNA-binding protein WhiA [Oscillospiraceae bacterium]|nr:DNA-binding protein WhiA [Oscillospiraceae bacterium]
MSFSADAKAELCSGRIEKRSLAVAECYGILLYCNTFHANEIRIITASPDFSLRLPRLFWKAFSLNFDVLPPENAVGKRSFCITDRAKIGRILESFGAEAGGQVAHHVNLSVLEEPGCPEAFVRGAFLAGGSVTDPEKRFHLELATSHQSVSRELRSLLLEMDLDPREASRGAHALLYFKKSDQIADFLAHIGAHVAAVSIHTAKVDKEMRNTVTRQINCDTANADKTVSAALKQDAAIRKLLKREGLDSLPEALRDAALLRLANPEASLADLALLSNPPVTKSCLSHRLNKIIALAEKETP